MTKKLILIIIIFFSLIFSLGLLYLQNSNDLYDAVKAIKYNIIKPINTVETISMSIEEYNQSYGFTYVSDYYYQKLEKEYQKDTIIELYAQIVENNKNRLNQNAKNIEKIAITDTYTVGSKVKEMFRELLRKPKFIFNKLYKVSEHNKQEVVTAFTGLLELSRRSKVTTTQEELFGDIVVEKVSHSSQAKFRITLLTEELSQFLRIK